MTESYNKPTEPDYSGDIARVFGEYTPLLKEKVLTDNPELSPEEAEKRVWHIIPEATAFMQPAEQEDIYRQALTMLDAYGT